MLFCIVLLVFNSFTITANANPLLIALGGKQVLALGGLLLAGGLVYANQDSIKASATDMYYNFMTSDVRANFNNAVNNSINDVVTFTKDIWDNVASYVSSISGSNSQTFSSVGEYIHGSDLYYSSSGIAYSSITMHGHTFSLHMTNEGERYDTYHLLIDGFVVEEEYAVASGVEGYDNSTYDIYKKDGVSRFYVDGNSPTIPVPYLSVYQAPYGLGVNVIYDPASRSDDYNADPVFRCEQYLNGNLVDSNSVLFMLNVPYADNTYDYSVAVGSTGWDAWEQKIEDEQKVEVAIPSGLSDLPDKTFENVRDKDYSGSVDTGVDTGSGTVDIDLTETNTKLDSILQEIQGHNGGIDPNFDPNLIRDKFEEKLNINVLKNALERLQNIDTRKGIAPVITINLNRLFNAGLSNINPNVQNPFSDEESTFIDFGILDTYTFGGYSLVDYFRTLIGAGFIYTTLLYVWRKIVPSKVVSR